jgi:hypothetical protein
VSAWKMTLFILLALAFPLIAKTQPLHKQTLYDEYPWAFAYYYGIDFEDKLIRITKFGFHRWPEHIQSIELAHTLSEDNFLRRLVCRIVNVVQLTGNFTVRHDHNIPNTIYEFDPYLAFRWTNLPWNHYITTSFAIGEGVSYATSYISLEKKNGEYTKRFLNYLMLEATFAAPKYPRLQLMIRIHHRSGVYGLYHAGNAGSNALGLGIKYLFD